MSEPSTADELKASLASLNLVEPEKDAERYLAAGDTRVVGIYGYSVGFPGVPEEAWIGLLSEERFRAIEGTSDCVIGDRHMELISAAIRYAERYNRYLGERQTKNIQPGDATNCEIA
jgi:hypothetical protein